MHITSYAFPLLSDFPCRPLRPPLVVVYLVEAGHEVNEMHKRDVGGIITGPGFDAPDIIVMITKTLKIL